MDLYASHADDINLASEVTADLISRADEAEIPRIITEFHLARGTLLQGQLSDSQKSSLKEHFQKLATGESPAIEQSDLQLLLRAFDL